MADDIGQTPQSPPRGRRVSIPKLKIPQITMANIPNMDKLKQVNWSIPAGCAVPIGNANGPLGIFQFHPTKASEFMNKRYENFKDFTKSTAKSGLSFGEKALFWINGRIRQLSKKWFTHIFLFLVVLLYSFLGAILFVTVEGTHEEKEKADIGKALNTFVYKVRSLAMEKDIVYDSKMWEKRVRDLMAPYESQLLESFSHGVTSDKQKTWSFWNSMFYCGTIYTTIGYGHISPSTTTGRAITIIYAIFGIPMFLILLADFGKLFTRGIKFVWAFVRRLYYTGSCRKVRKTAPVQEMMKGVQIVYDFAKNRKLSIVPGMEGQQQCHLKPPDVNFQADLETPGTPNLSTFEIDDEFNLPISVAISILLIYIFFGAFLYWMWEDWSFFESFYFVFISMSTIGFGDFVPQHPMYMMLSIVYLVFGLALTSMCINVVQEKLSDTFRQASAKLGTTIGLKVDEPSVILSQEEINSDPNKLKPDV